MAGGEGRRLGERTRTIPKPLLPVGGRPILDHVLNQLEDAAVEEVHIAVHYLADQIKGYVSRRSNRARISFVEEDAPLGTAGAIGKLDSLQESPVLVVNGDVITNVNFSKVHDFYLRNELDCAVCVSRFDVEVPFGVIRYGDDGLFRGIDEKPCITNFIAAGVYYLSPQITALVPRDRRMDMPELLNLGQQIGLRIGLFPIHEYWTDVGRPSDLEAAALRYSSN
jgi:NDP-sugar pyrophosphorylase family protein